MEPLGRTRGEDRRDPDRRHGDVPVVPQPGPSRQDRGGRRRHERRAPRVRRGCRLERDRVPGVRLSLPRRAHAGDSVDRDARDLHEDVAGEARDLSREALPHRRCALLAEADAEAAADLDRRIKAAGHARRRALRERLQLQPRHLGANGDAQDSDASDGRHLQRRSARSFDAPAKLIPHVDTRIDVSEERRVAQGVRGGARDDARQDP